MKKFLLVFCLTFLPFFSHADEVVTVEKDQFQTYLIYHTGFSKFNCYIIGIDPSFDLVPNHIVQNFMPEPLPIARKLFPTFNLDQQNYGFNLHESFDFTSEDLWFYPTQRELR